MSEKVTATKSEKLARLVFLKDQASKANKLSVSEAASYQKEVMNHLQYLKEGDIGHSQRIARAGWASHYYYVRFKTASTTAERREKRLQRLINRLSAEKKKATPKPVLPKVELTPNSTDGGRILTWLDDYGALANNPALRIELASVMGQHGYVEHILSYFSWLANNDKRVTETITRHILNWEAGAAANPPAKLAEIFGIALVPEPGLQMNILGPNVPVIEEVEEDEEYDEDYVDPDMAEEDDR